MYSEGVNDKNQFIQDGYQNMEKILEKFILHFNDIYGSQPDKFLFQRCDLQQKHSRLCWK